MTGPIDGKKPLDNALLNQGNTQPAAQPTKAITGSVWSNGKTTVGSMAYDNIMFNEDGTKATVTGDLRASSDGSKRNLGFGVGGSIEKDLGNGFSAYGGARIGGSFDITEQKYDNQIAAMNKANNTPKIEIDPALDVTGTAGVKYQANEHLALYAEAEAGAHITLDGATSNLKVGGGAEVKTGKNQAISLGLNSGDLLSDERRPEGKISYKISF